ncbi:MAG: CoA transferase [Candidatus Rokubacteria bacterium]|nr:CoA transferase [Candidatus Rokubacteria bacterium]
MGYDAPFDGVRVLDLSQGVAGPYAAMLLAQLGADVVKVEPPEGDWSRALGRRYGDHCAFSIAANLGKRSIAVDLKTAAGQAVVGRLAASAHVFVESFRPGVIARLGFGYEQVSRLNPGIIYLSVSGFGQTGPDAERPAVDTVFQAFTGLMSVNRGPDGIPHRVGTIVMDMATALCSFQALAVALYARRDEPRGRFIESSLLRGAATLQTVSMITHALEAGAPQPGLTPAGTFRTADGWLNLSILRDREFRALCHALERPDLADDPRFATNDSRFAHAAELTRHLEAAFARRPTEEWSARLRAARLMHQRVNDYLDFLRHPQVEASGAITWIEQPGVGRVPIPNVPGLPPLEGGSPRAVAPGLDQHRKEILAEIGLPA